MSLLDDRRDQVTLTPEIDGTDKLGNPKRIPDPDPDNAVLVFGRFQEGSSSEDETNGQHVTSQAVFICRRFPGGAWARIEFGGREWDVTGEILHSNGSNFTAHDTVSLTARQPRPVVTP